MAQETRMRSNHENQKTYRQHRSATSTTIKTAATAASAATIAHEDGEEIFQECVPSPYRKVFDMTEKMATTQFGQFVIARGDRLLKIVEITAKWSLPQNQMNEKLQRPLPWIPFLMIIIALRLARVWVSLGAFLIGNAPVKPQDVVYFIQTRRRKLRALRLRGMKEICRRENDEAENKSDLDKITFVERLKRIFSSAICRPGQHRETERRIMIQRGKEIICVETLSSEEQIAKRPRTDDCEADMTFEELLDKYANDNSENDSDFIPNEEESNDDSKSSSETSESSDENESQESQGNSTELNQSREDEKNQPKQRNSKERKFSIEFKENGNGEPIKMPKPMFEGKIEIISDNEANSTPKTPYENGPSNGADIREMDVEFKFVLTPPAIENGNKKLFTQTKPTNERNDADEMNGNLSSTINPPIIATAPELISTIDLNSTDTSSDDVDSPTPTLIAAFSSTSLNDLNENENKIFINTIHATAPSTQNIEAQEDIIAIASVSSSEDDFYSPIGSPPDFNTYLNNQMNIRFENLTVQSNRNHNNNNNNNVTQKSDIESQIVNQLSSFVLPTSSSASVPASVSATVPASAPVRRNQGHGQNRYRGRRR